MRILFTGATSIAGRRFFTKLLGRGHEMVAVSRSRRLDAAACCRVDLEAEDAAKRLPDEAFDALIHFACFVPRNNHETGWSEYCRRNLLDTMHLLQWAEGRIGRILVASSCAVYGTEKLYVPADEAHPLRPDTPYALGKYGQEQLVQAFSVSRHVPHVILRLGHVYGPDTSHDRLMMLAKQVAENQPITLEDVPASGFDLIHQDDVAYLGEVLLHEGCGVYNLVGPRSAASPEYACRRLLQRHGIQPRITLEAGLAGILPRIKAEEAGPQEPAR
jgi:UDP-glucose 4-epimerase